MLLKRIWILGAFLLTVGAANAQLQTGKKNIEKLCGCFDVEFKYAETFSPDNAYKFHERENLHATEFVLPVETSDKKIVLQHLLLINDSTIIKHWREDWVFEQSTLLQYEGNKQWTKAPLNSQETANKWVQTVWETDDAPRYQGVSQWVNTDGKTFWQSTVNAPLPRREYTTRSDYNILKRGNRIVVTDTGWVHDQDNLKVSHTATADKLIAEEKGVNIYRKIDGKYCEKAKEWWAANSAFWNIVRTEWDEYIKNHNSIALQATIDNKSLSAHFTALAKEWTAKTITKEDLTVKLKKVIQQFSEVQATASTGK